MFVLLVIQSKTYIVGYVFPYYFNTSICSWFSIIIQNSESINHQAIPIWISSSKIYAFYFLTSANVFPSQNYNFLLVQLEGYLNMVIRKKPIFDREMIFITFGIVYITLKSL